METTPFVPEPRIIPTEAHTSAALEQISRHSGRAIAELEIMYTKPLERTGNLNRYNFTAMTAEGDMFAAAATVQKGGTLENVVYFPLGKSYQDSLAV